MNRFTINHYWTTLDPCIKWTLVVAGVILFVVGTNAIYLLYPYRNVSPIEVSNCSAQKYPGDFPKVVHRVWLIGQPPPEHVPYMQHCDKLNPSWKTRMWNESAIKQLLQEYYPWGLDIYNFFAAPNVKSNLARYFILYHYGGMYMDTDIGCHTKYENIIEFAAGASVVLAHAYPIGITNYFIMNKPKHLFLKQVTENLKKSHKDGYFLPYFRALSRSGTVYLYKNYVAYPCPDQIKVIPGILDSYNTGSYFTHYGASAWHKADGKILWLFIKIFRSFSVWNIMFFVVCPFLLYFVWKHRRRQNTDIL